jgi:hypothetical protein
MSDCLCRPTGSTSFRAQVRGLVTYLAQGLICPKSSTDDHRYVLLSKSVLSSCMTYHQILLGFDVERYFRFLVGLMLLIL